MRLVSEWERTTEECLRPEKKDPPKHNVPVYIKGMVTPGQYSRITQ